MALLGPSLKSPTRDGEMQTLLGEPRQPQLVECRNLQLLGTTLSMFLFLTLLVKLLPATILLLNGWGVGALLVRARFRVVRVDLRLRVRLRPGPWLCCPGLGRVVALRVGPVVGLPRVLPAGNLSLVGTLGASVARGRIGVAPLVPATCGSCFCGPVGVVGVVVVTGLGLVVDALVAPVVVLVMVALGVVALGVAMVGALVVGALPPCFCPFPPLVGALRVEFLATPLTSLCPPITMLLTLRVPVTLRSLVRSPFLSVPKLRTHPHPKATPLKTLVAVGCAGTCS